MTWMPYFSASSRIRFLVLVETPGFPFRAKETDASESPRIFASSFAVMPASFLSSALKSRRNCVPTFALSLESC